LLILVSAAGLRFARLGELPLIGDESYYWLWSRRPAWSYHDHPAGVALLVRASTAVGGQGHLGIRWLNALVGTAAVFLAWRVGRRLLSPHAGLVAASAVALGAPYILTSRFVYTNTLPLLLMLANLLAFWRMSGEHARLRHGVLFGLTLALFFNAKYVAYVYTLSLAAAILLDHRQLLRTRRLWIGAGIAALGLLPVLVWNLEHDWVSFRWQLSHLASTEMGSSSLLTHAYHAWSYLTGPLVALAAAGLFRLRTRAERLLTIVALSLLLPVALSTASSPRNLSLGLVPLLMLAGTRLPVNGTSSFRRPAAAALFTLLLGVSLYGVGTVLKLHGPAPLPASSIVPAILRDAAGWPSLSAVVEGGSDPVFTVDYSLAGQVNYYTNEDAYTNWGQYLVWGIPPVTNAKIVSLDYVDEDAVTSRLRQAFQRVEGPHRTVVKERGTTKVVFVWHGWQLRWDQARFLSQLDFLTLLQEAGG
jgi:4-amino-4-deoxy-L-arabinose transferase-like glycosyltransferase